MSWIRSFQELSFFTIIGVFAIVCSVAAILLDGLLQDSDVEWSEIVLFDPTSALQFVGVVTFTFTIHYCVLSMGEEVLRDRHHIPIPGPLKTLSTGGLTYPLVLAYILSTACICLFGVAGYIAYMNSPYIRLIIFIGT